MLHSVDQVVELVLNFHGVVNSCRDSRDDDLTESLAQTVDGNFEGEISIDDTLIIGETALIKGTITGGTIVSSGRIEGVITANKKIQLLKPAVLIGDVHTPTFAMEEGVYFQGECDMGAAPNLDMDLDERLLSNGQGNTSSANLETESLSL